MTCHRGGACQGVAGRLQVQHMLEPPSSSPPDVGAVLLALYILVAVCTGGTCELLVVAATTVPDGRNHRCSAVLILLPWLSVAWRCSAQHAAQCIRRAGAYWSDLQVWPVLCCTHAQVAAHSRSAHPPPLAVREDSASHGLAPTSAAARICVAAVPVAYARLQLCTCASSGA